MYGQKFTDPGTSTFLKAGINDVKMTAMGIENVSTDKYTGPVLDFTFTGKDGGGTHRHRIFPVDPNTIGKRYQEYVQNVNNANAKKEPSKQKPALNLADFTDKLYSDLGGEIKAIMIQFMPAVKFDDYAARWNKKLAENQKTATFESFVKMCKAALQDACPDWTNQEGRLLLAYRPGSRYLSTPQFNRDCDIFFTTDPSKHLGLNDWSKMTFNRPDGTRPGGAEITAEDEPVIGNTSGIVSEVPVDNDDDLPF